MGLCFNRRLLGAKAAGLVLAGATSLSAQGVVMISQTRTIEAEAEINTEQFIEQDSHFEQAPDFGVFQVSDGAEAGPRGALGTSSVTQHSQFVGNTLLASGSISASAGAFLDGWEGESYAKSFVSYDFALNEERAYSIQGSVSETDNGGVSVVLLEVTQTGLVNVDQFFSVGGASTQSLVGVLSPGTYQFYISANGGGFAGNLSAGFADATFDVAFELYTPIEAYCTGKLNSEGCVPSVSLIGQPSEGSSLPASVTASLIASQKTGLLFYSQNAAAIPFQDGTLCCTPPLRRTALQFSSGNPNFPCSGSFSFDMSAYVQSGADPSLTQGAQVNAQYWYRDPSVPSQTGLSNAIEFMIAP